MSLTATQARALAWLALAAAAWWLLSLLAPVLLPFVVASVMAYALHPLVESLHRRRIPRWLGAGVAIVLLNLAMLALVFLIVPVVTHQVPLLRDQLPVMLDRLNAWLAPLTAHVGIDLQIDVNLARDLLRRVVAGHESDLMDSVLSSLRIGGSALAAVVGNLVLMPMVAYYLLVDWAHIMGRLQTLVPPRWLTQTMDFLNEVDAVLGQYLRGQLLVMVILAVLYSAGLALAGLKLALPIGVFTGLAVFVPYVGYGFGLVLGLLAAVLQFQSIPGVLGIAVVYGVGQVVESMFLTPRLLGERIGLHPIAVIFALLAFGHLMGFVGVLVALPASAVLLVVVRRVVTTYYASSLYRYGRTNADESGDAT